MELNLNDLKSESLKLQIGERIYNVNSLPFAIEEEIYKNMPDIETQVANIFSATDEWITKFRNWIFLILAFGKNGNGEVAKQDIDELSRVDTVFVLMAIVKLITKRIEIMGGVFSSAQKKSQADEK